MRDRIKELVCWSAFSRPPYGEAAAPAAHHRHVVREHDEAQWQHPEAEYRQEAEQAAEDKRYPHADAGKA
ncbi:hypothetical protein thsrh120_23790 [Rhizobium sp. No.120]